jgi:hypothetical protein
MRHVVEEETTHGLPGREGRGTASEHHVANGFGHGEINPGNNAMIDLCPCRIELHGVSIDGPIDMVEETEFAESKLKQRTPRGVIELLKIEDLQHMMTDVEKLDSGCGNRSGGSSNNMERIQIMADGRGTRRRRRGTLRHGEKWRAAEG